MNIHISKEAHETLQRRAIVQIPIGSQMYKIMDGNSDKDILCIYTPDKWELSTTVPTHHQLQYKDIDNKIDYVYTSLPQYLRNLIDGDSTINFEALFHPEMARCLNKIWRHRYQFITYNLIKCYLGMARRDLKDIRSLGTDKEKWDKLVHVVRGAEIAALLTDTNNFGLAVFEMGHPFRDNLKTIKVQNDTPFHCELSQRLRAEYTDQIEQMRTEINFKVQNDEMDRVPRPEILKDLDKIVTKHITDVWAYKTELKLDYKKNNYIDYFYDAKYNGIRY